LEKINRNLTELDLWDKITEIVEKYGFFLIGFISLQDDPEFHFFKKWIEEGRHASMRYLERYQKFRQSPYQLESGLKSALILGLSYGSREKIPRIGDHPRIAQYARYQDYHKVFWRYGAMVLNKIHQLVGEENATGRVFCDSAPLLERSLAIQSGGVFRGKNTCAISPKYGSMFFLGELFTSVAFPKWGEDKFFPETSAVKKSCGSCRRCQVYCPTGALDQDYRIDARKCIAYWTIENRETIPEIYWEPVSRYIFGCDICQLVCPFNRKTAEFNAVLPDRLLPLKSRQLPNDIFLISTMDQQRYETWFGGTPLTRAKREGLVRNALIALRITDPPSFLKAAEHWDAIEGVHPVIAATIKQGRSSSFLLGFDKKGGLADQAPSE